MLPRDQCYSVHGTATLLLANVTHMTIPIKSIYYSENTYWIPKVYIGRKQEIVQSQVLVHVTFGFGQSVKMLMF